MSTEDPSPAAPGQEPAPTPPPAAAAEPAPVLPPASGTPSPPSTDGPSQKFLLIVAAVVVLVLAGAFGLSQLNNMTRGTPSAVDNFTVQAYSPPAQLISASDHVIAYQKPDLQSPSVIMFGQGLALNVTGKVSRGLGNDWYAINVNGTTAFVRQQDAVAGTPTAPPITGPRVAPLPPREDTTTTTDEEGPDTDTPPPPAQSGPPDLTGVRWMHRPTRRDFQNAFPRRALFAGQQGHVTLSCTANGGGGLNCSVSDESPGGYGFGRAALDLSRKFRLEPTTPDGRSVAGGRIDLPIEFRSN